MGERSRHEAGMGSLGPEAAADLGDLALGQQRRHPEQGLPALELLLLPHELDHLVRARQEAVIGYEAEESGLSREEERLGGEGRPFLSQGQNERDGGRRCVYCGVRDLF